MYISERVNITRSFDSHPIIQEHCDKFTKKLGEKLDQDCGFSEVELDCRFSRVRTEETNLGNFMADLMMTELNADIALSNGGCLRANQVFDKGALKLRFMDLVMPMEDTVERIKMKGKLVLEAIENGLSKYPKYEGRWPVTAGIKMKFDPELEPGKRILYDTVTMSDGSAFDPEKEYVVAIKSFMKLGKDGYTMMLDPSIVDLPPVKGDDDPTIQEIFVQFFKRAMKKDAELDSLPADSRARFNRRLELFGTNQKNRDPATGAIKIKPMVDGRIVNIREPVQHED